MQTILQFKLLNRRKAIIEMRVVGVHLRRRAQGGNIQQLLHIQIHLLCVTSSRSNVFSSTMPSEFTSHFLSIELSCYFYVSRCGVTINFHRRKELLHFPIICFHLISYSRLFSFIILQFKYYKYFQHVWIK